MEKSEHPLWGGGLGQVEWGAGSWVPHQALARGHWLALAMLINFLVQPHSPQMNGGNKDVPFPGGWANAKCWCWTSWEGLPGLLG